MMLPDLEKAIRATLHLSSEELTTENLKRLTELNVHYKFLDNLEGLEGAVNLRKLVASGNRLTVIKPLTTLVNLAELDLHWCQITDLIPLANLRKLHTLNLKDNHIFQIHALRDLVQLEWLDMSQNIVTDLKPLQGLTNLISLSLGGYTDNPIGSHTAEMYGNPYWEEIKDISPLAFLKNLEYLCVMDHGISSLEPLRNMKKLEKLVLSAISGPGNISDISPLADLPKLREVHLVRNHITDLQPLIDNPQFANGAKLSIGNNLVKKDAQQVQILRKRGVIVEF